MRFSIISIGTEINLGLIINTNSKYIAESLTDMGLECNYMLTVRDNEDDIVRSLQICSGLSEIIIISGGLGPTDDDMTRSAVARFLNTSLVKDNSLDSTSLKFLKYVRNEKITENLLRQSYIPYGSEAFVPRVGSASGFMAKKGSNYIFSIPGVPREMKDMFDFDVCPQITDIMSGLNRENKLKIQKTIYKNSINLSGQVIKKSVLLSTDISESQMEYSIRNIKPLAQSLRVDIGVTANPGLIKIMLIARSDNLERCKKNLKIIENKIRSVIGEHIYWKGDGSIGDALRAGIKKVYAKTGKVVTISTAESITGGLISSLITDTPGSSEYFLGSVISYNNNIKNKVLGVDLEVIDKNGSVSPEVCIAMAENAKRIFKSDYALSTTGIAGPTSPEKGKKVGLVFAAIVGPDDFKEVYEKKFIGIRADVKFRTAQFILNRLRLQILK
ncbi:MAG: nicotinamide-nucleotide amidohydrolase family protein [Actinobacteria bacterium]|nr:nicotinamide-nucleotide amidohydrolase family protein [Actinomycetota bacterium]